MALNAINTFIASRQFGQKIDRDAKARLSAVGVEQYIFDKNLVLEWCSWIQGEVSTLGGITVTGKGRRMTAAMFKTLKNEFKKDNSGQGIHFAMENNAFVVTQLNKQSASFQKAGSSADKAIRAAKRDAVAIVASSLTKDQREKLQSTMHGHHSDVATPRANDPITTGGLLKVEKDTAAHRESKGMSSAGSLEDILNGIDQRSSSDSLYHLVLTRLSDHIQCILGFDRVPLKMLDKSRSKAGVIEVDNIIHIKFALGTGYGPGKIGSQYTKALKEWDAGTGGGLANNLTKILDRIQADLIRDIIRASTKFAPELIKLRGSASIEEHVQRNLPKIVIDNLFPHKTKADMRFKVNKKLHALAARGKMSSNEVRNKKVKGKKSKNMTKMLMASALPKKSKKKRGQAGAKTSESPIALRNLLNQLLPAMVASKMTAPALQFRTGRFANSARVENVNLGPRGGTHVDYTYQREPYETFKPGNKQGSTQRDPRKIIGASLRELAQGILGRQLSSIRRN